MAMFGRGLGQKSSPYPGIDPSMVMPPIAGMPDFSVPTDPYEGQRPMNGGIMGSGVSLGDVGRGALVGAFDGLASHFGAEPQGVQAMQRVQQQDAEAAQAMRLAQLRAQLREPTALQRNFEYLGIDPNTPQGRQIGIDSIVRPTIIGNPEMGYFGTGGSYGQAGGSPQVIDVKTIEEATALPPGTQFRGADGVVRVR